MKPKTLILLVVAVGCGLVASYMTSRVIADRSAPQEAAKVPVVYATKTVQQGLLVKNPEEYFQVRMIPEGMDPPGKVIRDLSELKDKRLVNPILAGKHVSQDDLLGNDAAGLSYRIPNGMRAVSVKVSQDTSVSGFVQPGMFVDIMCVPNGRNECKTILQKVQVLAINQLERRDPERNAIETHFVTFATSPNDSEKLALATHSGHLRLSLRSPEDDKLADTTGANAEDLRRLSRDTEGTTAQSETTQPSTQPTPVPLIPPGQTETTRTEPVKVEPPQPKKIWTMTIAQGTKVDQHHFYDEPPIAVEKSEPEGEPEAPGKQPAPESKPEPTPKPESKTSPTKTDGKK